MPHFFPIKKKKKAQFPFSFHSFACLRYFYIITVKHSCPWNLKCFPDQLLLSFHKHVTHLSINCTWGSSQTAKEHFPTFGHEIISGQCIILVFLLKKCRVCFWEFGVFIFYFVKIPLKCNGILFLFRCTLCYIFGDRMMNETWFVCTSGACSPI